MEERSGKSYLWVTCELIYVYVSVDTRWWCYMHVLYFRWYYMWFYLCVLLQVHTYITMCYACFVDCIVYIKIIYLLIQYFFYIAERCLRSGSWFHVEFMKAAEVKSGKLGLFNLTGHPSLTINVGSTLPEDVSCVVMHSLIEEWVTPNRRYSTLLHCLCSLITHIRLLFVLIHLLYQFTNSSEPTEGINTSPVFYLLIWRSTTQEINSLIKASLPKWSWQGSNPDPCFEIPGLRDHCSSKWVRVTWNTTLCFRSDMLTANVSANASVISDALAGSLVGQVNSAEEVLRFSF